MGKVWESDLPSSEKFVLLALADHARDDGSRVYPSIATTARKTGFSKRTVQRNIRTLQAMGILAVVKKSVRYGTTEYIIRGDNLSPLKPRRSDKYDIQGCHGVISGVTNTTSRGDTVSPESLENHQMNHKRETSARDECLEPAILEAEESHEPDPCSLADHSWQQFREIMPLRNGKFMDEDTCREKWIRTPALWNQWLAAARNYAASAEVRDGAICNPMKFIKQKWRDWRAPEILSGASPPGRAPDLSWMKNLEEDEKIFEREKQAGPKERPIPSWAQQTTT